MSEVTGTVFNVQRYSIDDGPGIRTTVFLKGCPLKCLWCSNPESQSQYPEITHRDASCIHCGQCVQVCTYQAIAVDDAGVHIARDRCTACGKCVEVCDPQVLKMMGKLMTVAEVFEIIERDVEYYESSNGGVTLCGGEPLLQPEFTTALLKRSKESGLHTCLDTSGYGASSALRRMLPYTSLVFYDVKHTDLESHRKFTGKPNTLVMKNLELIVESGTPVVIRVPVIPGVNDSENHFARLAEIVSAMSKDLSVNLLPYHRYGLGKYKMLDLEYKLTDLQPPTKEEMHKAKGIIESFGLSCEVMV